jgi:hypothetical protein
MADYHDSRNDRLWNGALPPPPMRTRWENIIFQRAACLTYGDAVQPSMHMKHDHPERQQGATGNG